MDAAKNITTTEIKCGTALGSSERKSMELMPRKVTVRCPLGPDAESISFTSSKSMYSPSLESSARRAFPSDEGGGWGSSAKPRGIPPATKAPSSQRQMNHTPTMYTTVRSSPKNMRRRSAYLLK